MQARFLNPRRGSRKGGGGKGREKRENEQLFQSRFPLRRTRRKKLARRRDDGIECLLRRNQVQAVDELFVCMDAGSKLIRRPCRPGKLQGCVTDCCLLVCCLAVLTLTAISYLCPALPPCLAYNICLAPCFAHQSWLIRLRIGSSSCCIALSEGEGDPLLVKERAG